MRVDVVTIFPDYFGPLGLSLVGKARERHLLEVRVHDLREWTGDRHRTVDDTPYGGGAGMVMKPDIWGAALDDITEGGTGAVRLDATEYDPPERGAPERGAPETPEPHLIVPTPAGQLFTQRTAAELAEERWLVFACGRYEGIDARVVADARTRMRVTELSIGDYVLNGGEVAALVMLEAVVRLLPGVVGNPESLTEESHGEDGLLEYPVYTKPPAWRGLEVPEILLSGHHARVARWRRDEALRLTVRRRPDLIAQLDPDVLDDHDRAVLAEVGWP